MACCCSNSPGVACSLTGELQETRLSDWATQIRPGPGTQFHKEVLTFAHKCKISQVSLRILQHHLNVLATIRYFVCETHTTLLHPSHVHADLQATRSQLEKLADTFQAAARTVWPMATVQLFGSYSLGLNVPGSDIDMVIVNVHLSEDQAINRDNW